MAFMLQIPKEERRSSLEVRKGNGTGEVCRETKRQLSHPRPTSLADGAVETLDMRRVASRCPATK